MNGTNMLHRWGCKGYREEGNLFPGLEGLGLICISLSDWSQNRSGDLNYHLRARL